VGLIVGWACATANVADNTFQWLVRQFEDQMIVLSDTAFHAAEGDPTHLKLCQRGEWEDRMLVETVLSMLTLVCHFKKVRHRGWAYFQARLAFTMAAFKVLVQWHGFHPNASGFVPHIVCKRLTPLVTTPHLPSTRKISVISRKKRTHGSNNSATSLPGALSSPTKDSITTRVRVSGCSTN
jgi:hypothetical protein